MMASVKNVLVRIHRDDEGMESIQIIMILAVAAMVCLGVTKVSGIASNGTPDGGGLFGAVGGLVKNLIPGGWLS